MVFAATRTQYDVMRATAAEYLLPNRHSLHTQNGTPVRQQSLTRHLSKAGGTVIDSPGIWAIRRSNCSATSFSLEPFSSCASSSGVAFSVLAFSLRWCTVNCDDCAADAADLLATDVAAADSSLVALRCSCLVALMLVSIELDFFGDRSGSFGTLESRLIFLNSFFKSVVLSMQLGKRRWCDTTGSLVLVSMCTGVDEARTCDGTGRWPLFLRTSFCWRR